MYRYAVRNGLQFINHCIECSAPCKHNTKFCSSECSNIYVVKSGSRSAALIAWNSIPENKEFMWQGLIERHAKIPPIERHNIRKKAYANKSQEWIDSKSSKAIDTRIRLGQILPRDPYIRSDYTTYRNEVRRITNSNKFYIPCIENRGKHTFHVDHIYPIVQGFLNKIPAALIGDIKNLRMLDAIENKQKNGTIIYVPNHIQEYINDRDNKGTL